MDANIKSPQDALEWLDRSIRDEAELDGEMSNYHAIQLGFIQNMLAKFPRRNCDVGTLEDRRERFKQFCKSHSNGCMCGRNCPLLKLHISGYSCHFEWSELPIESGV